MPSPTPTNNAAILDEIVAALREGESFCLSGHQNPDADVVGSQLAMASLIRRLDAHKRIHIRNSGNPPRNISYLKGYDTVENVQQVNGVYDVVIVFECSGADRMGNIIDFKNQAKKVINIDHHLHNPNFGDINFVEPETSTTAELIFKIFEHARLPLTQDEAIAIFTGLVADTGWFRYGNTNPQSHRIASALLEAGVPVADLSERMYLSKSRAAIQLLAWVLTNMKLYHDNRVALLTIPEKVFRELGATPDDTDEVVNFGLQIESVVASILIKERTTPPSVKVSLRSKGNYDINQVARLFGGGGHRNASGCGMNVSLAEAESLLTKEIARIF